jgi:hypothetical protein
MAMSKHEALRKVSDLLNLAEGKGTDPNEAAVAAARAEAIMERYNLERATVEAERGDPLSLSDEEIEEFTGDDALFSGSRLPAWRVSLASGLAEHMSCSLLLQTVRRFGRARNTTYLNVIGKPSDVAVFKYIFRFAEREIDRLARRAVQRGEVYGRTGGNNYRHGAVRAVVETVRDQRAKTRDAYVQEHGDRGRAALVRVDQSAEAVEAWLREKHPRLRKGRYGGGAADYGAQRAGYRDGKQISLNAGLGGTASSGRMLGSGK